MSFRSRYQTRECSFAETRPDLKSAIRQHLEEDDQIRACYETIKEESFWIDVDVFDPVATLNELLDYLSNLAKVKTYMTYVVTQNRLILAATSQNKRMSPNVNVHWTSLHDVVSISAYRKADRCYVVSASGHGESSTQCMFASEEYAHRFSVALSQAVDSIKSTSVSTSSKSPSSTEDRLQVLTKLHKDGLVSDAEFQQKRSEILKEL